MSFDKLNLVKPILEALQKKGYTVPTPVQNETIPVILSGKDVFGSARTGTGKTAAFALPLLQLLHLKQNRNPDSRHIKALILAPTRELALQISENITAYGSRLAIKHVVIFGGVGQRKQTDALRRGVDIVVATPGRLLDLINQGFVNLGKTEFLVLDEADRMLDMGFIRDIRKLIAMLPVKRQTLFFSATLSPEILKLSGQLLNNPVCVTVAQEVRETQLISQHVYYVEREHKKKFLSRILTDGKITHALVFTRTKHGADKVVKDLLRTGITAEAIHGNKSQGARERSLQKFRNRSIRILVATDIASRGIDVDKLSHVINFEIPELPETYVHRIGRTGRAGIPGNAISLCSKEEKSSMNGINRIYRGQIQVMDSGTFFKTAV